MRMLREAESRRAQLARSRGDRTQADAAARTGGAPQGSTLAPSGLGGSPDQASAKDAVVSEHRRSPCENASLAKSNAPRNNQSQRPPSDEVEIQSLPVTPRVPPLSPVVLVVTSLRNPFLEAWVAALRLRSSSVAVLLLNTEPTGDTPQSILRILVAAPGKSLTQIREQIEVILGGTPGNIFYWWGLHSARDPRPAIIWPAAKRSLCVDTYPNASRLLTELRELLRASRWLASIDCVVVTSREMADMLQHRLPSTRQKQIEIITSPFPISAHGTGDAEATDDPRKRLIFTGRSDFLYSGSAKMAKDDPSTFFESLISKSLRVFVQHPGDSAQARLLLDRGFDLYPHHNRASLLDGAFSQFLATFDANLIYYATPNGTLRRRVKNSLSTRFATGLCAPTPMIVPKPAEFAASLFADYPIGIAASDAATILDFLTSRTDGARRTWAANHIHWSAEGQAETLGRILS